MPNLDFSKVNIDDIKSIKESNPTTKLDFSKVDISDIKNIKQQIPVFTGKLPELNYDNSDNAAFSQFQTKQQELKNVLPKTDDYKNWMEKQKPVAPTPESVKQKEDETLLKSSQVNLNISDESLAREGEYGVNRSTYGNTQRLVNNYQQSKALLNDPNADGDLLKEDVTNRLKSIEAKKIELEANKKQKEHFINERWNGQNSYEELAKVNKEYQNQINELNNTFLNLKQVYTSPEQRVKYNPLLKLVKEDPNVLTKLTQEQWDKFTSDYGTTLTYLGEPENEVTYLQAKYLNQLDQSNRIAYEALKSGSVTIGTIKGLKGGTDKKVFQQIDRYGELAMIDDISKYLEDKNNELKTKYEEINKDREFVKTKEDVEEFNNRLKELEPEAKQLEILQKNLQDKYLNTDLKYKELKKYEDYQKQIDYFDELQGHSSGFGTAFSEYIGNFPITASTGIKQLITKLEDKKDQDLSSFENLTNYKWNTVQIPSYYKDTPVFEKSDKSPLGFKVNKSIWYNMGKTSIESLALAGMAGLSGGTSLAAEAGITSLKGVLSGLGAASTIVVPTMIMTSSQASLDYLEQGIKPSLANDMGLITGFIEGLTEVANPIELTTPLRLTTLANRFSNRAAYRITLNNVFQAVTGKAPSRAFLKAFTASVKEFSKEFVSTTGMEVLEEEIGLFLNGLKNQHYKEKIIGFQPSPEEEVNITNILMTAANTTATMPLLGFMGAGAKIYQNYNSALPTAKFIVGQNASLHLERLEEDFKNQLIPKEVYEAAKTEIPRLQSLYKANEFTIANLPNEDKQIGYFQLVDEQQELVKKLATNPENEELSKKLDNVNSKVASLQKEALINSAKTPQEKYEVAEKLMIDGINKLYTPEFLKTANLENVKKDLQKRYDFLKSPKVYERANEILQQIQDLETKEQEKTEVVQQDEEYAKTKKEESLLNSILTKIKEEDSPSLTEEETEYFDNNQQLVRQKIQEVLNQNIETKEDVAKTFEEQKPTEDIEAKIADIERRRQEELVSAVTIPISYEEFAKTKPESVIVNNFDVYQYDKDLKKYVLVGGSSSTDTSLESITVREKNAKNIEFFKDKSLKLDAVNFFWSERTTGKSPITRLNSYKKRTNQGRIDERVGEKLVEINAKYDAELAALEKIEKNKDNSFEEINSEYLSELASEALDILKSNGVKIRKDKIEGVLGENHKRLISILGELGNASHFPGNKIAYHFGYINAEQTPNKPLSKAERQEDKEFEYPKDRLFSALTFIAEGKLAALEQPKEEKLKETKQTTKEKIKEETNVDVETNLTPEQERQLLDQTEEDVTKANKTSLNFIAKLTKIEEEQEIPETGFAEKLLLTVWDKIAYQARKFVKKGQNLDDSLNSEYSFLNSPEIKEGHELIFKLSPTNEFLTDNKKQFEENKDRLLSLGILTEDEFNDLLNDNDDFIQIDVTDNKGRNFGSLHTIDYIREDRVVGQATEEQDYGLNLKENLYDLIQQRKQILEQLKKGITPKAVITNKTIGSLSIKADKSYVDLKDAIKNQDVIDTLQVVLKPNDVVVGNKTTVNSTILSNMAGQVVVLLPTPQGNNFALGLKKKTLGNELAKSAINAIKFYKEYQENLLSGNVERLQELDEVATQIVDKSGAKYDIRDFNGLKDYISLFVYNNAKTSKFTSPDNRNIKKDIPFIDFDTKNQSITFSNKRFFASKETTEELTSISKLKEVGINRQFLFDREGKSIPITNFLEQFEKFLSERSLNIKPDLFQSEEIFEIPLLSDNYTFIENDRVKAKNYKEFVINNTETNVLESTITSPSNKQEFSYFQQPTISFEIEKPKPTKKKTKLEEYKETEEFKNKIIGFTSFNYNNKEFFYKLENSKITILNTKGNKLKPSAKNYPNLLEIVLQLNYSKLEDSIDTFNRLVVGLEKLADDSFLNKEGSKEWRIAQGLGKIHFIQQYENKPFGSEAFAEIRDILDIPAETGEYYKVVSKLPIYKNWLTNDAAKGNSIDEWVRQINEENRGEEITIQDILDFITEYPNGAKEYLKYSQKDFETKQILVWLNNEFGIAIKPKSLLKISYPFYNVQQIMDNVVNEPFEEKELSLEELEEINRIVNENFTEEDDLKYIEELNLTQEYNESLKEYINYENQVEQTESDRLDDSTEEIEEETSKEEKDELDDFSFYNEEKESVIFEKINNYPILEAEYLKLSEQEKQNIGNLTDFIQSYENTGLPITEEFLIEELNCRKSR